MQYHFLYTVVTSGLLLIGPARNAVPQTVNTPPLDVGALLQQAGIDPEELSARGVHVGGLSDGLHSEETEIRLVVVKTGDNARDRLMESALNAAGFLAQPLAAVKPDEILIISTGDPRLLYRIDKKLRPGTITPFYFRFTDKDGKTHRMLSKEDNSVGLKRPTKSSKPADLGSSAAGSQVNLPNQNDKPQRLTKDSNTAENQTSEVEANNEANRIINEELRVRMWRSELASGGGPTAVAPVNMSGGEAAESLPGQGNNTQREKGSDIAEIRTSEAMRKNLENPIMREELRLSTIKGSSSASRIFKKMYGSPFDVLLGAFGLLLGYETGQIHERNENVFRLPKTRIFRSAVTLSDQIDELVLPHFPEIPNQATVAYIVDVEQSIVNFYYTFEGDTPASVEIGSQTFPIE